MESRSKMGYIPSTLRGKGEAESKDSGKDRSITSTGQ